MRGRTGDSQGHPAALHVGCRLGTPRGWETTAGPRPPGADGERPQGDAVGPPRLPGPSPPPSSEWPRAPQALPSNQGALPALTSPLGGGRKSVSAEMRPRRETPGAAKENFKRKTHLGVPSGGTPGAARGRRDGSTCPQERCLPLRSKCRFGVKSKEICPCDGIRMSLKLLGRSVREVQLRPLRSP